MINKPIPRLGFLGITFLSLAFVFGPLLGCDPKTPSSHHQLLMSTNLQSKNQGKSLLEHFNQQYQAHERLLQNGKNKEPLPNFNLPNQKQIELLIRRLARTGESRERLLEMKEDAVPYLCFALLNVDRFASPFLRRECAILLGELNYVSSARYLILAMQRDEDIFVQLSCINALSKIRSPESIEPMRAHFFLKDTSVFLRSALAIALAEVGDREMIPHFQKLFKELPITKKPYRKSKERYLAWHLKQALKILTGELNTYFSEPVNGSGIFAHPENSK